MNSWVRVPLTKGKSAIVSPPDFSGITRHKWHYTGNGYAARDIWSSSKNHKILMHREILSTPNALSTDHINRNTLDNRRDNLRIATKSQNGVNIGLKKNNRSGYTGVSLNSRNGRWEAYIKCNYKRKFIGYYDTLEDAVKARQLKAMELFGEFAV